MRTPKWWNPTQDASSQSLGSLTAGHKALGCADIQRQALDDFVDARGELLITEEVRPRTRR